MLSASTPPDPATLHVLHGVLSADVPLAAVHLLFRRAAGSSTVAATQAAACCDHLLRVRSSAAHNDGQLGILRPPQRLAAMWVLMHIARADMPADWQTGDPTSQRTWHMQQLRQNPFLETLLQLMDALASHAARTPSLVDAQQHVEHAFLSRLLLPAEFLPSPPLCVVQQLSQWHATALKALQEVPLLPAARLEAAMAPLRSMLQQNQPPPALAEAMQAAHDGLHAELCVPTALAAAVLGESAVKAMRHASASSSAAAASAASAADANTLSLRVHAVPPHWSAPPIVPLDWGTSSWEELLHDAGDAAALLPPECSWMTWDPPADLDWQVTQIVPGSVPASSPAPPLSPHAPGVESPLVFMLTKACKSQLPAAEKAQLLAELKACEPAAALASSAAPADHSSSALGIALHVIPPSRLPLLVEKNHELATEMLRQLILATQARALSKSVESSSASASSAASSSLPPLPTVNSYLCSLVLTELSLHGLEVAKALSVVEPPHAPLPLPADFLPIYLARAMESCSKGGADKYKQHRHVRLLCAFITTLIRKKIIRVAPDSAASSSSLAAGSVSSPSAGSSSAVLPSASSSATASAAAAAAAAADVRDGLLAEISSFLVSFAAQKEAATLYQLIKSLESQANR